MRLEVVLREILVKIEWLLILLGNQHLVSLVLI